MKVGQVFTFFLYLFVVAFFIWLSIMGYFVYKYIRSNGLVQSYYYDKIINLAIIGVIGIVISLPTFQTIYILELEPIKDIETQFYPTKEEIQE